MVARSVDPMRLYVREATSVLNERRTKIAGRKRSMDADGQSTTLTAGAGLEVWGDRFRFLHDAPRGVQEFLAGHGRSGPTVGALEKCSAQLIFKIAQAPAESGLSDVERFGRLPKTAMLGRDDGPF